MYFGQAKSISHNNLHAHLLNFSHNTIIFRSVSSIPANILDGELSNNG